jgi:hypothetical protein
MQTVISVEQLSKSYGNLLAVDKISLSVKRGTVEQAKTASQCESFEDAYLMISGEEAEKE